MAETTGKSKEKKHERKTHRQLRKQRHNIQVKSTTAKRHEKNPTQWIERKQRMKYSRLQFKEGERHRIEIENKEIRRPDKKRL
jgi:Leu/Phe-tRNA-protein transferase